MLFVLCSVCETLTCTESTKVNLHDGLCVLFKIYISAIDRRPACRSAGRLAGRLRPLALALDRSGSHKVREPEGGHLLIKPPARAYLEHEHSHSHGIGVARPNRAARQSDRQTERRKSGRERERSSSSSAARPLVRIGTSVPLIHLLDWLNFCACLVCDPVVKSIKQMIN